MKLKTVPSTGGPPQILCDATNGGGSWSRDGVILFADSTGPIQRVSAAGGACTTVTKTEDGMNHRFPEFLPDGKHFLYFVDGGNEAKQGVYLAALDNPTAGGRFVAS